MIVAIDRQHAELHHTGTSRPDVIEACCRGAFDSFLNVRAFALGMRMEVIFPDERADPWSGDLRGARAGTEAFLACARRI